MVDTLFKFLDLGVHTPLLCLSINLFSMDDGRLHYDVHVEHNHPDVDVPKEDEMEEQAEGPRQEA
jgi:hypothetical protein